MKFHDAILGIRLVLPLASLFLPDQSSAVMLHNSTTVLGNLYDVNDPLAEIRITISKSLDTWTADHHASVSYDGPLPYIQAYHDESYPGDPEAGYFHDPDHIVVRWDAFDPVQNDIPAGSTAWVTFSSNTAFVSSKSYQPTLAYFYHLSERPGETMTLIWSNTPSAGRMVAVPEGGMTLPLLGLAIGGLGAARWLWRFSPRSGRHLK